MELAGKNAFASPCFSLTNEEASLKAAEKGIGRRKWHLNLHGFPRRQVSLHPSNTNSDLLLLSRDHLAPFHLHPLLVVRITSDSDNS